MAAAERIPELIANGAALPNRLVRERYGNARKACPRSFRGYVLAPFPAATRILAWRLRQTPFIDSNTCEPTDTRGADGELCRRDCVACSVRILPGKLCFGAQALPSSRRARARQ